MDEDRLPLMLIFLIVGLITISTCSEVSFVSARHKLFTKSTRANSSIIYYQHRLAIGQLVQLPCFLQDSEPYPTAMDPVAYEWRLNGRQILTHLSFMTATWDLDGVLTIFAIMPREYTLWCHMRISDETEDQDFYFAHQIKFFQEPVRQLILGVLIRLSMDEEAWERKCEAEQHTCDCQRIAGENATERFSHGSRNYYMKMIINDIAIHICERFHFCHSFSLDQFECLNMEQFWNASHYMELSFFLDGGRFYLGDSADQRYDTTAITEMVYKQFLSLRSVIRQRVLNATLDKYYAKMRNL
ncbi:unnamed protein product [Dicrocoelium dendriticum]|nr:unnamed protein product [Dicrocoelium dendriticum]